MTEKREIGTKFIFNDKVYVVKPSERNPENACWKCDLLYKCIESKPIRGACIEAELKLRFKQCGYWGTLIFNWFGK